MTLDDAKALTAQHKNKYDRIYVTEDGSIYLNADLAEVEKTAKKNNLEIFHVKPERIEKKPKKS